jgi:ketosteroid isomerase-like protein
LDEGHQTSIQLLVAKPKAQLRYRISRGGLMASTYLGGDQMAQNNLELMRTLDDSWNAQDWDTFEKRHSKDTTVFWPGQAQPTRGRDNHKAESIEFFKTFPDNHLINHPYKVEIAQGEWTCTVADFTGTMRGPMKGSDGKLIAPTNKKFHIEFCTVAHWQNGEIIEEKLFYDLVGLLKQIGVM